MRVRHFAIACIVIVVLGSAAVAAYRHISVLQFEEELARWTEARRAEGYQIAYDGPNTGGFPFAITASFAKPSIQSPEGWSWNAASLVAEARLWTLDTIELTSPGLHNVTWQTSAGRREASISADKAHGMLSPYASGEVAELTAHLGGLAITGPYPGAISIRSARLNLDAWRRTESGAAERDFALEIAGIGLPTASPALFGSEMQLIAASGTLKGALSDGQLAHSLARWRDAGGTIEVGRITLAWGPIRAEGSGTMALDEQMRPLAAFAARVRGVPAALDSLVEHGIIERRLALAAQAVLLALAGEDSEEGDASLRVPMTIQDGRFFLGPVPLFEVRPVL